MSDAAQYSLQSSLRRPRTRWKIPSLQPLERLQEPCKLFDNGVKWCHQRKLASFQFSTKVLQEFSTVSFKSNGAKLAKKISLLAAAEETMDLQDLLMRSTLDLMFKVGFGFDLDTLSGSIEASNQFMEVFDESNGLLYCRFVDLLWKVKRWAGRMIQAESEETERDVYLQRLMDLPNQYLVVLPNLQLDKTQRDKNRECLMIFLGCFDVCEDDVAVSPTGQDENLLSLLMALFHSSQLSAGGGSEVSDDATSWEIIEGEDNEMENIQKALENGPEMSVDTDKQTTKSIQTNGALSIPLASLGFMTRRLALDLKLVANIGTVGAPNAGKRIFLCVISADM
ncbi:unnamed protein product [Lactuca saligna]|uniref:Uncharacterized protein n=1 Tax=Lactuca saligna TaxID=75948 RepID=A0AA35VEJ3_LACSI|nr:unnamed protein product [Lactuca saligna]